MLSTENNNSSQNLDIQLINECLSNYVNDINLQLAAILNKLKQFENEFSFVAKDDKTAELSKQLDSHLTRIEQRLETIEITPVVRNNQSLEPIKPTIFKKLIPLSLYILLVVLPVLIYKHDISSINNSVKVVEKLKHIKADLNNNQTKCWKVIFGNNS